MTAKRPGRVVDSSRPTSGEVKKKWSYIAITPYTPLWSRQEYFNERVCKLKKINSNFGNFLLVVCFKIIEAIAQGNIDTKACFLDFDAKLLGIYAAMLQGNPRPPSSG